MATNNKKTKKERVSFVLNGATNVDKFLEGLDKTSRVAVIREALAHYLLWQQMHEKNIFTFNEVKYSEKVNSGFNKVSKQINNEDVKNTKKNLENKNKNINSISSSLGGLVKEW